MNLYWHIDAILYAKNTQDERRSSVENADMCVRVFHEDLLSVILSENKQKAAIEVISLQ